MPRNLLMHTLERFMRSEQTRSPLSRPLATTLILLASGLACSSAAAEPINAQLGQLENVQIKGRTVQHVQIENVQAASSIGTVTSVTGQELPYFFTNNVIVQATDWDAVQSVINTLPGLELGRELGNEGLFRVIQTANVGAAFELQQILESVDGVITSDVDSGMTLNTAQTEINTELRDKILKSRNALAPRKSNGLTNVTKAGIGIKPVDSDSNPASIPSSQWHFTNAAIPDHDNNILESIYSTDLLTGAGVTIGFASAQFREHLDVDHTELVNAGGRTGGYRLDLSQPFPPTLEDDSLQLTQYAGLIISERNNPVTANDLQGVAPGASLLTKYRGQTPLIESQAYEWKLNAVDIRVNQIFGEFNTPMANYNPNYMNRFITDAYNNSLRFGRGRKGTINVFGLNGSFNVGNFGLPSNLLANPYLFFSEPWDVFSLGTNTIGVSLTNGFLSGPFYAGPQTVQFPLANEQNSLMINAVSEDGEIDTFGAVGPGVFASVYAGTNNEFWSGDQGVSGRGVGTTAIGTQPPGSVNGEGPLTISPEDDSIDPLNSTASSITAGIIALMLEANPRLRARDIRHIFYESIQESMRPDSAKWPNFDRDRNYYQPGAGAGEMATFWQTNNGLYNNPNPPVTVPPTDPVENQAIRHSDQYGFGVIDANLAIQKAKNWSGLKPLVLLDSGVQGDIDQEGDIAPYPNIPQDIADATFTEPDPAADGNVPVVTGASTLLPGVPGGFRFCVRSNIQIESIIIELTLEGDGSNDLYIELRSPTGTRSILLLPTTSNLTGMTTDALNDDELDIGFGSGGFNDDRVWAYYQHPFLTNKHWGEMSGGTWDVSIIDFGPDVENPEGAEPGDDLATEPGADTVVDLGEIGVPGSTIRSGKTLTGFRAKFYGTDTNLDPFFGCDPIFTSCPSDLNGDGIVNVVDLQLFLSWYQQGDARADVDDDGQVNFADVQFYFSIFDIGYCVTPSSPPLVGGRPVPGPNNASDTNPPTRPF